MHGLRFSLIIPAYNEAALLPRLLQSVDVARSRLDDPQSVEVIVADNASTDATAEIARQHGCVVAPVEKRCIAAARNGGARLAGAPCIGFVDADSPLHPDCFSAILAALADERVAGGATGVVMERWSLGIALSYGMMLPVVWATGFDTGIVFCRRADFESLGGYDERRAFAEDVDFLRRLKRIGRARGQRLRRLRGVKTITSTRKFDRHGDWHYFIQIPRLAWQMLIRPQARGEFVQHYWYDDR